MEGQCEAFGGPAGFGLAVAEGGGGYAVRVDAAIDEFLLDTVGRVM